MIRAAQARIVKLEIKRKRRGEVLIVWRKPDGDVSVAISGAKFIHGDKVVCPEWFGPGPPPPPKWCHRMRLDLTKAEQESIDRSMRKIIETKVRPDGLVPPPRPLPDLVHFSDGDLLHMALGIET